MFGYNLFWLAPSTRYFTSNAAVFLSRTSTCRIQSCGYAKKIAAKGKGKGMVQEELKGPEVCKDPVVLTSRAVGVNIFKQGEDPLIKPREEYPEWLFQLNLGKAKKLNELEPDTWEYWRRIKKESIWRHNRLHKGKKL